jgi:hypothetical protein
VAFCLSIFFIFMSVQSHTTQKQDICLRGMLIFRHYTQLRRQLVDQQTQTLTTSSTSSTTQSRGEEERKRTRRRLLLCEGNCLQEIFYNLALVYSQIKLTHLSEYYLKKVLALSEQYLTEHQLSLTLTREAAHNLVAIYRDSENEALAMETMSRYLSFP